ncbi:hypothetical protein QE152_g19188 [Popillia japonica]|uniref:Uncharacterized protein n=1 Tax=Popillia japonica TaxID=7064 RepID=A0AAW1KXL4_POPJA
MAGVFERSKKTQRSPSKHRGGEESKLDMIIDMMQKMKQEQSEIKKEIQQIRAEQTFFREKEKQKQIREMALKEKREGKMVKIGYNKITVDGEEWRWNRNEEKLDKIETKN